MAETQLRKFEPVRLDRVTVGGPFWAARQEVNRTVTLATEYAQCKQTGRIDAWKLDWRPGQPNQPHQFWDSDLAKWIEGAAYSLATHPDPALEDLVDDAIALIAAAQHEDGYLNIYFSVVEPGQRWTNLAVMHELYCAGHLMEAAVAYYEATGKKRLLDVLCRYADHIAAVFGPGESQKPGYPGHEEIELALVKLYRSTGESRYLDLARFFLDARGRQPHYFDVEAAARGDDAREVPFGGHDYTQSHLPVREQTTAEGHAVRAMYLYSGMVDVAVETGDEVLLSACETLWRNVTGRRMYVTGGIGSSWHGERFTTDYDLPNETAYAETCAAIGLVFWAHRMLQIDGDGQYADVMERALYNGVLSGLSLDGKRFFYANPLEANPTVYEQHPELFREPAMSTQRQGWFDCACCPPNIARLLASLGGFVFSKTGSEAFVHLYTGGQAALDLNGQSVTVVQETHYPWDGEVRITVNVEREITFALALRIPGWSRGAALEINGREAAVEPLVDRGYAKIERTWSSGDTVTLHLPMPVERIYSHPSVRANCGRVALQRGPLIFCLEEVDNGPNLNALALPREAPLKAEFDPQLLEGVMVITGQATRSEPSAGNGALYQTSRPGSKAVPFQAVPYYAWANRAPGEMLVWIRET